MKFLYSKILLVSLMATPAMQAMNAFRAFRARSAMAVGSIKKKFTPQQNFKFSYNSHNQYKNQQHSHKKIPSFGPGCLSMVLLTAKNNDEQKNSDIKEKVIVGTAITAGIAGLGAYLYGKLRPLTPEEVKRNADGYLVRVVQNNGILLLANSHIMSDDILHLVTEKGKAFKSKHVNGIFSPISDDNYISEDCARHAPILRGYTALLEESEELYNHYNALVQKFGSVVNAQAEYPELNKLTLYAAKLQQLAYSVSKTDRFNRSRDAFAMHRTYMKQQEILRQQIEQQNQKIRELQQAQNKNK